jgi:hypothetical protein
MVNPGAVIYNVILCGNRRRHLNILPLFQVVPPIDRVLLHKISKVDAGDIMLALLRRAMHGEELVERKKADCLEMRCDKI